MVDDKVLYRFYSTAYAEARSGKGVSMGGMMGPKFPEDFAAITVATHDAMSHAAPRSMADLLAEVRRMVSADSQGSPPATP